MSHLPLEFSSLYGTLIYPFISIFREKDLLETIPGVRREVAISIIAEKRTDREA